MKYPVFSKNNVIDITKSPYNADNTGKIDCTKILQQAINDCLKGYIDSLNQLRTGEPGFFEQVRSIL